MITSKVVKLSNIGTFVAGFMLSATLSIAQEAANGLNNEQDLVNDLTREEHQEMATDAGADVDCSDEILLSYFPEVFVGNTLTKFKVPESEHDAIKKALALKDKEVIPAVEKRANAMNPNPLRNPSQRHQAVKIFRETLYNFFADVMNSHGITEKEKLQAMLDDIQEQKAKRFTDCMEKLKPEDKEIPFQAEYKPLKRLSNG